MKQFEVGQRVTTQNGIGTIVKIEEHLDLIEPVYRYGIKHDVFPENKQSIRYLLKDDVLYYFENEVRK